jgi:hypothetical protein
MHARCPICSAERECCASSRLRGVYVCLSCHFDAASDFFDVWLRDGEAAKREPEREARIKAACKANDRVSFGRSARRVRRLTSAGVFAFHPQRPAFASRVGAQRRGLAKVG